jgi:hypothetical protein
VYWKNVFVWFFHLAAAAITIKNIMLEIKIASKDVLSPLYTWKISKEPARPKRIIEITSNSLSSRIGENDFPKGCPSFFKYKILIKSPIYPGVIEPTKAAALYIIIESNKE